MEIKFEMTRDQLLSMVLNNDSFQEKVASEVVNEMKDFSDEIRSEYLKVFREEVKKIVIEYTKEYYDAHSIRNQLDTALKSLTRKEVFSLLSEKEDLF